MISRIIAFSARNPFLIILLIVAIVAGGLWAVYNTPLDAISDLSDVQVIVFSEWMGRAPDLVEDNITYPVVSSMLGSPRVTAVRGQSMFGMSFVNVIFEDGTDIYFARQQISERLAGMEGPEGRPRPKMGPIATGLGRARSPRRVDAGRRPTDGFCPGCGASPCRSRAGSRRDRRVVETTRASHPGAGRAGRPACARRESGATGGFRSQGVTFLGTNMLRSSGLALTAQLLAAGVAVGLGVDGSASNDSNDLRQEVKQAILSARARDGASVGHAQNVSRRERKPSRTFRRHPRRPFRWRSRRHRHARTRLQALWTPALGEAFRARDCARRFQEFLRGEAGRRGDRCRSR